MIMRPRGTGLRIWASILAIYALLLHAPTMAAFGSQSTVAVTTGPHAGHGTHGKEAQANANTCCVVCAPGVCSVGPVGTSGLVLPAPLLAAHRVRPAAARQRRKSSIARPRARGPPTAKTA